MSYNTGNLIECSTLQVALEEVWQASPVTEMMPLEDVLTSAAELTGLVAPIVHNTRLGVIMPTGMMNAIDKDQLVFAGVADRIV